jgi:orotate phosphoribosyltransferase
MTSLKQSFKDELLALLKARSYEEREEGNEITLASGRKSRFYIDVREVATHPRGLLLMGSLLLDWIMKHYHDSSDYGYRLDAIACVELGGVPIASAVSFASAMRPASELPVIIVRKASKDHGVESGNRLVGMKKLEKVEEPHVVLIEDVATFGGSALSAIKALEDQGVVVNEVLVMVDRQEGAEEFITSHCGCGFSSLFTKVDFRSE